LWDNWKGEGGGLSCAIITVDANDRTKEFHDRMPAILMKDQFDAWLDTGEEGEDLLRPAPEDYLVTDHVSKIVNNVRHEGPECIVPV
jgi:putative SOS response-associated peptidase YedK